MQKKKPQERAFRVFGPVVTVKMALQIKRGEVRSTSRAGILIDYSRHIRLDDGRVEPRAARVAEKDGLELPTTTLYVINLDKSNSKETVYAVSELAEGLFTPPIPRHYRIYKFAENLLNWLQILPIVLCASVCVGASFPKRRP